MDYQADLVAVAHGTLLLLDLAQLDRDTLVVMELKTQLGVRHKDPPEVVAVLVA
jgi:hypothetical protein